MKRVKVVVSAVLACFSGFNTDLIAAEYVVAKAEYNFSYWKPTGIDGVDYKTKGLNALELTFNFEPLALNVANRLSLPFVPYIPSVKYLFTPEDSVEQKELLANTETVVGKEALEYLWIDIPVYYIDLMKGQEESIRFKYEKAAFLSRLTLLENKEYWGSGSANVQNLMAGEVLQQRTDFEKFTAIIELANGPNAKYGIGYYAQKYNKPYSATISGQQVSPNIILDSEFSSEGVVFMLSGHSTPGTDEYFSGKLLLHYGKGDVSFSENKNIDSLLDPNKTTALFLLNTELEYRSLIGNSSSFSVTLGYDHYYFHQANETQNGIQSNGYLNELDINSDHLFYLEAGLVIEF